MNKTLKIILIVLAFIVGISAIAGVSLYFWGKGIFDKITFGKPIPTAIDLQGLSIADVANIILSGSEKKVNVTLSMPVKNDSDSSVTFSKFRMKLFYQDVPIAETSDKIYNESITVPAHSSKDVTDTVTLNLNTHAGRLILDKLTNKNPEAGYKVDISVFGVPVSKLYPIEGTFAL